MFLTFCLVIISFLLIVAFVTQILVPAFTGTPLFPLFRNSEAKKVLNDMEAKLEEAVELAAIQDRLAAVADKVNSKIGKK